MLFLKLRDALKEVHEIRDEIKLVQTELQTIRKSLEPVSTFVDGKEIIPLQIHD